MDKVYSNLHDSTEPKLLHCGDGCVFAYKETIVSDHKDSRVFTKYRCLLGHGRGNFVSADDFCSWATDDESYFREIKDIIQTHGFKGIGKYQHHSSKWSKGK